MYLRIYKDISFVELDGCVFGAASFQISYVHNKSNFISFALLRINDSKNYAEKIYMM